MNKIIIILIILVVLFIYNEYSYVEYAFDYIFKKRELAGVSIPLNNKKTILKIIKELPPNDYTFIDFGCGEGNVINLVNKNVNQSVCIEIEKKLYDIAQNRFKNVNNIKVLNIDMKDYEYKNTPTILFLYEPLWSLKKDKAIKLYEEIFKKIPRKNELGENAKPFYIIYVTGIYPYLDESFFKNLNFKKINQYKFNRLLGIKYNSIYLFERY